jgi:hypothetical protein
VNGPNDEDDEEDERQENVNVQDLPDEDRYDGEDRVSINPCPDYW